MGSLAPKKMRLLSPSDCCLVLLLSLRLSFGLFWTSFSPLTPVLVLLFLGLNSLLDRLDLEPSFYWLFFFLLSSSVSKPLGYKMISAFPEPSRPELNLPELTPSCLLSSTRPCPCPSWGSNFSLSRTFPVFPKPSPSPFSIYYFFAKSCSFCYSFTFSFSSASNFILSLLKFSLTLLVPFLLSPASPSSCSSSSLII